MANRNIAGTGFVSIHLVAPGNVLFFLAGNEIAVEKFETKIGNTEFDYQVNSRATKDGKPIDIATMQKTLDDQYYENRIASRNAIMADVGNVSNIWKKGTAPDMAITAGERSPQVFTAGGSPPIAWSINFKATYYDGTPGALGGAMGAVRPGKQAGTVTTGNANRKLENIGADEWLNVYIEASSTHYYKILDSIGDHDYIGTDTGFFQKMWDRVHG